MTRCGGVKGRSYVTRTAQDGALQQKNDGFRTDTMLAERGRRQKIPRGGCARRSESGSGDDDDDIATVRWCPHKIEVVISHVGKDWN